ncbi:MAG: hypothetical protein LBR69_06275 [Endomicrobium sp.]|jgi:chromosome segregation ATPase|nr:hypothetical protein [Endomicrobium sp.]
MGNLEILSVKVKKAAERIKKLNYENMKLKAEIESLNKTLGFYEQERKKYSQKMNEFAQIEKNAEHAILKIERILKKIDTAKAS